MNAKKTLLLLNPAPNPGLEGLLHLEALGLGYLAASVRGRLGKTHDVYVWDCAILDPTMEHVDDLLAAVRPDYVGISICSMNSEQGILVAEKAKRADPATKVLIGGILASSGDDETIACYKADAVIRGEGELLINDVLLALDNGAAGPLVVTQDSLLDVDTLAWPSRDMLPWQLRLHPQASVASSRGCPFKCGFCSIALPGAPRKWRPRDIEDVVAEMEFLHRDHAVSHFYFVDDNFVLNTSSSFERAEKFAKLVLRKLPHIRFGFMCRSAAVDKNLFKLLKKAGMAGVFLGVESFSQAALDRYDKKELAQEHTRAVGIIDRLGLTINPGYIFFDPWTNAAEVSDVIDAMGDPRWFPALQSVNTKLTCYKGTAIERELGGLAGKTTLKGATGYRFQDERIADLFKQCVALFSSLLPGRKEYVDYQTYCYGFGYVQPYFINTPQESVYRTHYEACRLYWHQGDKLVLNWIRSYANGEPDLPSIETVLDVQAKPLWERGNAHAESFFKIAQLVLAGRLAEEDPEEARLTALAFTSPIRALNMDCLLDACPAGSVSELPLAEMMSHYRGTRAAEWFARLLSAKDDHVAAAAVRSALRIIHPSILDFAVSYLDKFGNAVSPELNRELLRAQTLFSQDYIRYILRYNQTSA